MTRQWTPLSVDLFRDPKVRKAGRDAALLFVASLCYCQDQLTDGHIPADHLAVLAAEAWTKPGAAKALVAHGLWVEDNGGYLVARWGEWNRPAAEVRESIEAKSQGGAYGNHVRWHVEREQPSPTCRYCSQERSDHRSDERSHNRSQTASHIDRFSSPQAQAPLPTEKQQLLLLDEAVEIVVERRDLSVLAQTKDRPDRWLAGARRGIAKDIREHAGYSPVLTADELADLLEPAPVVPLSLEERLARHGLTVETVDPDVLAMWKAAS